MISKLLRIFAVTLALMMIVPNHVFAQNQHKIECYDTDCVFEILKKLNSSDRQVVAEAEQAITELVEYYRYSGDSRVKYALTNSIIPFAEKFSSSKSSIFLISQLPKFCNVNDIDKIIRLVDNEQLADCTFRAIGDIKGSGGFIMKYIYKNHDNLKYKAALAYGIGKQNVREMEDELISWLKGADEPTKVEIYNALVVIRSNENTTKIIAKGAKKLYKSKVYEYKITGMRLLATVQGEKSLPILYKALKNKDGRIRKEALELMKPFVNQEVVENVVKKCSKGEAAVDATEWLGDIKNDSQMQFVLKQLNSNDSQAVRAAIRAIFKIDNEEGINAVKPMFGGVYQDVIKESMLDYNGDYRSLMNDLMKNGNDQQKLAALQILQERPIEALNMRVKELVSSNNQQVRDLAYKVMKLMMPASQSEFLKGLLEYCDDKYVEDVQLAIKRAMKDVPVEKKDLFASTLKHVRSDIMPRYYKIFAYFGTKLCVEKLIDAYQNGAYKFDAREALLMVENEAYKDRIAEVLQD